MTKRATKTAEGAEPFGAWTGRQPAAVSLRVPVRCIWHTRLVIEPQQVPSGTRYDFQPGDVRRVDAEDAPVLLAMEKHQTPCCGAVVTPVLRYFEIVT